MKKWWSLAVMGCWSVFLFGQEAVQIPRVSLTVSSLEKLVPFYEKVLSFRKIGEYEWSGEALQRLTHLPDTGLTARIALMQLGEEQIELVEFRNENRQLAIPFDSRSNDLWFQHIAIVVGDMEAAYQHLRRHKVQHVSSGPQTLPDYLPAAAGISAFYFRDPDGHNLEIIHFPKEKGNPKWQQTPSGLFLGIDHTAIGIGDTDSSLAFYQELLGLKVAGNSENYGPEQEHLNQVFGARLLITGLKAQQGPGLEFLDYLAPPAGRAYPADSRPTDLWHWHTWIRVNDIDIVYRKLQKHNRTILSSGTVELTIPEGRKAKAFLARDGDGHVVFIFE